MKFLLLATAVIASLAAVQGGVSRNSDGEPSWMVWPDDNGNPRIAILNGPIPEEKIDTTKMHFLLYTVSNPTTPVEMFIGNPNGAPYDPAKPTKLIVHGYNSNGQSSWIIEMKDIYLRTADLNVFVVDWGEISDGLLYNLVQSRTKEVGIYLGEFLIDLAALGGSSNNFHCIGHSLGSHACGVAGKTMRDTSPNTMGRVTGMDPALPLYGANNTDETLASGDANYVDVIHTCGGWLGFMAPLGHADFYPNEGVASQPGCGALDLTGSCSHSKSHEFFAESITSFGFVSHSCSSWDEYANNNCNSMPTSFMGEPSDPSSRGNYYLRTNANPPYAQG